MVVLFCLFRRDQSNPAGGRAWRSSDRRTCRSRRRELEQDRRNNRWNPAVCCASPPEDDAQQHLDLLRRPSAKTFCGPPLHKDDHCTKTGSGHNINMGKAALKRVEKKQRCVFRSICPLWKRSRPRPTGTRWRRYWKRYFLSVFILK